DAWWRRRSVWAVAAVFATLTLVMLLEMLAPLGRDEGTFLTVAQEIQHGRLPYRDAFDHKGPGIYYLLTLLLWLTRSADVVTQILLVRSVAVLANLATAAGLVLLGRSWWRTRVGVLAATLWLFILPAFGGEWMFTEPFAVALALWAFVIAARSPGARGVFLAGLLIGLGSLFKQTAILALPGLLILLLPTSVALTLSAPRHRMLACCGLALAGMATPWMATAGAFTLAGALGPFLEQTMLINLQHYPADPPASLLSALMAGL